MCGDWTIGTNRENAGALRHYLGAVTHERAYRDNAGALTSAVSRPQPHFSERITTRVGRGCVGSPGQWPRSSPPRHQHPDGHSAATTADWRGGSWPSTTASSHSARPGG